MIARKRMLRYAGIPPGRSMLETEFCSNKQKGIESDSAANRKDNR